MEQDLKGRKTLQTVLKAGLGICIVMVLFYKVGVSIILKNIFTMSYWAIPIGMLHVLLQLFFSAYNIKFIADALHHRISYSKLFKYYLQAWGIGKFFPGGVGELSIAYMLKRQEKVPTGDAVFISIFDKSLTLLTQILIGVLGAGLLLPAEDSLLISAIGVVLLLIAVLLFFSGHLREMIKRYILRKYSSKFKGFSENVYVMMTKQRKAVLLNMVFTFLKSLSTAGIVMILFYLLGIKVGIMQVLVINTFSVMVGMIPITIAGLGTKEGVAIYLYSLVGINAAIVLSVYLFLRAIMMVVAVVLVMPMFVPKGRKQELDS